MADLAADLQAHLAEASTRAFVWGDYDCLAGHVGRWIERRRGFDPAAPWRGRYHSAIGAALIVHRGGGLVEFLRAGLALGGIEPTDDPQAGDVGAVKVYGEDGPTLAGAVCVGPRWTVLTPGGLLGLPPPAVMAWRV